MNNIWLIPLKKEIKFYILLLRSIRIKNWSNCFRLILSARIQPLCSKSSEIAGSIGLLSRFNNYNFCNYCIFNDKIAEFLQDRPVKQNSHYCCKNGNYVDLRLAFSEAFLDHILSELEDGEILVQRIKDLLKLRKEIILSEKI